MKNTYRIVEISFGRSHWDGFYDFEFMGKKFQVQRFGTNFSVKGVQEIITRFRNDVDAFALRSIPPVIRLGDQSFAHRQYLEIMSTPTSVPLCDGTGLRELSNINSLIKKIESREIQPELGMFFPAALLNPEIEEFIRHRYSNSVYFGDAYSLMGLPLLIRPFPGLMTLTKMGLSLASFKDLKKSTPLAENALQKMNRTLLAKQVEDVQYVVGDLPFMILFDQGVEFIRNKDLIIWSHHTVMEQELEKYGPRSVINLFPEQYHLSPNMNYSVLDAAIRITEGRTSSLSLQEWENYLNLDQTIAQVSRKYLLTRKDSPQLKASKTLNKVKNKLSNKKSPDFAFVVHALSHRDFEKMPVIGTAVKHLPKALHDPFDRAIAKVAPPFVYGEIKNIVSEKTGQEINGIIYALASTPKVLKTESPEAVYAKIQQCCYDAAARGAKIIGLGAYTKVVGDSGVTINQNSPIPVTTGNSLSASATLWGLYDAVRRMGLLTLEEDGRVSGSAMVIGATGSIGKVSAKLLALAFKKLYIVAPREERLRELAIELRQMAPKCEIILATDANQFASEADVVVTATSAFDQKIVDVMKLKPGCVVCDCSRPLDFSKEDARKRPDVLIIESGELILPGPYDMTCNIGLPGKTVYACLAETAVLTMEGRFESFTLGRDIDWIKVKEIYKLCQKHGVKLAEVYGHMGMISDKEITLTKELALSKRAELLSRSK